MDDRAIFELVFRFGLIFGLLAVGLFAGSFLERRHFGSIRVREEQTRAMLALTFETPPADWRIVESALVTGSVVVSLDYFKRFWAGLRMLFGGRIRAYEPLLERGRREAVLRLKDRTRAIGFDAVINVRLETSRLATANDGTAGVEILAFCTAVKRSQP